MKADYVHKDSLTTTGYDNFVKAQSIKESILRDTKDYGRTQFVDEIYRLQEGYRELEDNWNKLFQWVNEQEEKAWDEASSVFGEVSNKMKELEESVSNDC